MRKFFRKHVEIAPYEEKNSLDRFCLQTFCVYRSFYISVNLLMRKKSRKKTNFVALRRGRRNKLYEKTQGFKYGFTRLTKLCRTHIHVMHTLLIFIILVCVLIFLFSIFRTCCNHCFVLWRHTQFHLTVFSSVFLSCAVQFVQ